VVGHVVGRDALPRVRRGPSKERETHAQKRGKGIKGFGAVQPSNTHARQHKEAVQISSLKGDQISAQGFNPGLGNSRRCALKGHHNPARQYRIEIIRARLLMLAPLSGRIFGWQVPRVETLGSALLPLRGADLVLFPYVDARVQRRSRGSAILPRQPLPV
jgi:hypothetical protein